jgi:glycosyltransferase involved in cell wall biosynthesis
MSILMSMIDAPVAHLPESSMSQSAAAATGAGPLFTVFTPTFNRAHTLHRVFDSLCAQTCRDFEWLIVDDGSTDNTADIVADWARTADFPIRYLRQENAGKHIAHNRAIAEARAPYTVIIDSDDALAENALARIKAVWHSIPADQRDSFSGVSGLCRDQHGEIVGDPYPAAPLDASIRAHVYEYKLRGERCGMVRTDILRRFPFPDIPNTCFVPEGVVWLDLSKHYKQRAVNEVFRIYYVNDSETGGTLTRHRNLAATAPGRMYYYTWLLNNDMDYLLRSPMPFLKAALMLPIVGRHAQRSLPQILGDLHSMTARGLVLLAYPLAMLALLSGRFSDRPNLKS